jgi:hypothetical protein
MSKKFQIISLIIITIIALVVYVVINQAKTQPTDQDESNVSYQQ